MPIVPSLFAHECVWDGLYFAVQPHYLMAVARLRSHIVDDTQGDLIGPFRLTRAEWAANSRDDEFGVDFLPTDITLWRMQCSVFALMTQRTQEALATTLTRNPSAVELYMAQWPGTDATTLPADLRQALDDTAPLLVPAVAEVLDDPTPPSMAIKDPVAPPPLPPPPQAAPAFNFSSIPKARWPTATQIVDAFGKAGYGRWQQAAALANAIRESGLKPDAHAGGIEDSWGLFQLNRRGGLGSGKTPAFLRDPGNNIQIVVNEVGKFPAFAAASTVAAAVSVFVRKVERPANADTQVALRLQTANKLLA